jgi:hypothetical protein
MSGTFVNMSRAICHRRLRRGAFRGAYVVTVRFDATPDETTLTGLVDELVAGTGMASGEIWTATDPADQPYRWRKNCAAATRRSKVP